MNRRKLDKLLNKAEFEAKKKLKNRQYEIDALIHSYNEADDNLSKCLNDLINIATGALDEFKGSDATRKRELLNLDLASPPYASEPTA